MSTIKYSILTFNGDGSRLTWPISFAGGFISREHVKAYTTVGDDPDTTQDVTLEWIGENTVKVDPPVPSGRVLTIYRDTPKDEPLVSFTDDAVLNENDLAVNAKQAVFIAAEMVDKWGPVTGWSNVIDGLYSRVAQEAYIREQADLAEAGLRTALEADLGNVSASLEEEKLVRASADAAEASQRTALAATVNTINDDLSTAKTRITNAEAAISNETIARANAISAEAAQRATVAARVSTLETDNDTNKSRLTAAEAAITNEATARATAITAEATTREAVRASLQTQIDGKATPGYVDAQVASEALARASAISAEAAARETVRASLQTQIDGKASTGYVDAAVFSEATARATAIAAEASSRETVRASLQTQIDGVPSAISGAVSVEASARAAAVSGVQGQVNSIKLRYAVRLEGDVATGFELIGDGSYTVAKWKVSYFAIIGPDGNAFVPFEVDTVNNRVNMTNVYVQKLYADSVTSTNLASNAAVIPAFTTHGPSTSPGTGTVTVATLTVNMPFDGTLMVFYASNMSWSTQPSSSASWEFRTRVDGTLTGSGAAGEGGSAAPSKEWVQITDMVPVTAGSHTITVQRVIAGSGATWSTGSGKLVVVGYPKVA